MDSWWNLGEWNGYDGNELSLWRITCPFCMEKGNFKLTHREEKKKPNESKKLYFDTYECGNCKGYVMVFWSGREESFGSSGMHSFRVVPWPLSITKYPEHWPEDIGRYWLQAKRNLAGENWDAASVMARSALQLALRENKAKGNNLKQEIEDLSSKGILPPLMKDWSEHVRELGNDSAHPKPQQAPPEPEDATDIVNFLDFLLEYLYDLPNRINNYRKRKKT